MVETANSNLIFSKRKAINALLPYAIYLEQDGQQEMIDAISRAARVSTSAHSNAGKFMWRQVVLYISRLFEKQSPTSLDRVITLISPYVPWDGALNETIAVDRWAAAVSTTLYTQEVGQSVVDTLFQIAWVDFLRPHIPDDLWEFLKRQPSFPPTYRGPSKGGSGKIVVYVRGLGLEDIQILKSYFLLLWTDLYTPSSNGTAAMERSILEDFGGPGKEQHRKDLSKRLDRVLGRLDQRLEHSPNNALIQTAKKRYKRLKDALVGVDGS